MKTVILLIVALFAGVAEAKPEAAPPSPVPAHGQAAPYDRAQALESFSKTVHGGVMHIMAKSANDAEQVRRIQHYLRQTAGEFQKGDFSSTERYHGSDMPGLMQMKGKRLAVPPTKNIPPTASCDFLIRSRYGHHIEMATAY